MIVQSVKKVSLYLTQRDSSNFDSKICVYIEQFIFSLKNISLNIIENLALSLKNYILEK